MTLGLSVTNLFFPKYKLQRGIRMKIEWRNRSTGIHITGSATVDVTITGASECFIIEEGIMIGVK